MKRLVLAVTGTIAGVTALLSFKTQTAPVGGATALPSAGLSTSQSSDATPTRATPSTTPSAATPSASPSVATTKAYLGPAITTRYGIVQVKITVTGPKITNVAFAQLTSFDGHSAEINSYAGPQLLHETLDTQSANVDTVSGATYTSDGYRNSLQSALDQAGI